MLDIRETGSPLSVAIDRKDAGSVAEVEQFHGITAAVGVVIGEGSDQRTFRIALVDALSGNGEQVLIHIAVIFEVDFLAIEVGDDIGVLISRRVDLEGISLVIDHQIDFRDGVDTGQQHQAGVHIIDVDGNPGKICIGDDVDQVFAFGHQIVSSRAIGSGGIVADGPDVIGAVTVEGDGAVGGVEAESGQIFRSGVNHCDAVGGQLLETGGIDCILVIAFRVTAVLHICFKRFNDLVGRTVHGVRGGELFLGEGFDTEGFIQRTAFNLKVADGRSGDFVAIVVSIAFPGFDDVLIEVVEHRIIQPVHLGIAHRIDVGVIVDHHISTAAGGQGTADNNLMFSAIIVDGADGIGRSVQAVFGDIGRVGLNQADSADIGEGGDHAGQFVLILVEAFEFLDAIDCIFIIRCSLGADDAVTAGRVFDLQFTDIVCFRDDQFDGRRGDGRRFLFRGFSGLLAAGAEEQHQQQRDEDQQKGSTDNQVSSFLGHFGCHYLFLLRTQTTTPMTITTTGRPYWKRLPRTFACCSLIPRVSVPSSLPTMVIPSSLPVRELRRSTTYSPLLTALIEVKAELVISIEPKAAT